jgi:hypothetical protein
VTDTADLTLRLLREMRDEISTFRAEFHTFREEMTAFRNEANVRFGVIEHTLNGLAGHVFALTHRLAKLEASNAK